MIEKLKFLIDYSWENVIIIYRVVLTIGVVLLIIVFYLTMSSRQSIIAKHQLVNDFQQVEQRVLQYQSPGIQTTWQDTELSLLALIEKSAAQAELSSFLTQVQQTRFDHVMLNFDAVPFDRLITWLEQLTIEYGVNLEKISAVKLNQPGAVKAEVLLSR